MNKRQRKKAMKKYAYYHAFKACAIAVEMMKIAMIEQKIANGILSVTSTPEATK